MTSTITPIDIVSLEQSSKRKNSSETIYDYQELFAKLSIQSGEIDDLKKQLNEFKSSEMDVLKKQVNQLESAKSPSVKVKPGPNPKNLPIYQLLMRDIINPTLTHEKEKGLLDSKDHKKRLCELIFKYWTCPKIGYYVEVIKANPQANNLWDILRKIIVEQMDKMTKKGLSIGFDKAELKTLLANKEVETLQSHFSYEFEHEIKAEDKPIKEKDLLATFNAMNKDKHNLEQ